MKVKKYKARSISYDKYVEGFYYQQPAFTEYCFSDHSKTIPIKHYIVIATPGDWGLPYSPQLVQINPSTLEELEEITV